MPWSKYGSGWKLLLVERLLLADSVEKVAPLSGLRQNCFNGLRGITQHDGTVIEWAGAAVLLVQP
jgi:hypothetical protein